MSTARTAILKAVLFSFIYNSGNWGLQTQKAFCSRRLRKLKRMFMSLPYLL